MLDEPLCLTSHRWLSIGINVNSAASIRSQRASPTLEREAAAASGCPERCERNFTGSLSGDEAEFLNAHVVG